MATKSFLYGSKSLSLVMVITTVFTHIGCVTTRRSGVPDKQLPTQQISSPQNLPDKTQETKNTTTQATTPTPVQPPTARQPKIGLILGPGGMRAHAHLGVLQELERSRIPVSAIVGIEWGAVVGALYSVKGSGNDAEWKLYKMRNDVLASKGLFSLGSGFQSPERLNAFLQEGFGKIEFSSFKVDFACPSVSILSGVVVWQNRGSAEKALKNCVPYPPLFKPNSNWVAANGALFDAIETLKKKKIDIIILVDVLGSVDMLEEKQAQGDVSSNLLWLETRNHLKEVGKYVHEVLVVDTGKLSISDFESRRDFLQQGRKHGQELARRLSRNYGL